jgi:phosphoglycolate phosphatase-like HAD superfamily hydrolase
MTMLVLFDVDATLITTSRAGIDAMGRHGRSSVGDHFDEHAVEYSGRIDPLIIKDLLLAHDLEPTPERIEAFRLGYKSHLTELLNPTTGVSPAKPCPGVPELLDALEAEDGLTLGLLTGNFPDTGAVKLAAAGIDIERFAIRVWGDDSPHDPPSRDHLPGVALERWHERSGEPIDPAHVLIIGDTPHDIACARAHDCRVLAVATGAFSVDELARADRAVEDLSATEDLVGWITAPLRSGANS